MGVSKGVQVYAYIAATGCQVEFCVPKNTIVRNQLNQWSNDHLEVDSHNINGPFNYVGRFSFRVTRDGEELTSQWVNINTATGNLENGTMNSLAHTPSIVTDRIVITYGFYDAGSGKVGLPSSDQCYVTVTLNCSNWMGTLAPTGSSQADKPFSHFVLPAAHDVGMNSMQNTDTILQHSPDQLLKLLALSVPLIGTVFGTWAQGLSSDIIYGLAITQKDSLASMLAVGARYFEFRPAHLHKYILPLNIIPDKLYFMHACIPGMAYEQFLQDTVYFLSTHPSEIIVVQLRQDGVLSGCEPPSDSELQTYLDNALKSVNNSIAHGTLHDMRNLTTAQLRSQQKRLILFPATDVYSTYTDAGNATLNGDSIIAEYEKMNPDTEKGKALTNIQCQATASNIKEVLQYSVVASNASTSCLMATKAICDTKTLPWIRKNALEKLPAEQLTVIMNDFIDGATVDTAVELSRERLG